MVRPEYVKNMHIHWVNSYFSEASPKPETYVLNDKTEGVMYHLKNISHWENFKLSFQWAIYRTTALTHSELKLGSKLVDLCETVIADILHLGFYLPAYNSANFSQPSSR